MFRILPLLFSLSVTMSPVDEPSPWEWEGVPRVVAIGDVHGAYDKMVALLQDAELIDSKLSWTGDETHLVLCGDLTDRGPNDRSVMDLARRLQIESEAAGGRVHVVLGNHDVMNLTRDRRYWTADLLDEFAADETDQQRRDALVRFRQAHPTQGVSSAGAFDDRFPAGYFARARAFEPEGEYGRWLLAQPTAIKVNGVVYVHGGLTRRVARLGLDEINRRVREGMLAFLSAADELGDDVPFPQDLTEIVLAARAMVDNGGRSPRIKAAKAVLEAHESLAFDSAGPLWYRGNSVENERLESDRVKNVLDLLDARAVAMGHTVTRSGRISTRFNGTIVRLDVGMGYGNEPLAAVFEGDGVSVLDPATRATAAAVVEPPQGEGWPAGEEDLPAHELERFLRKAKIKEVADVDFDGVPAKLITLELRDMTLRALFGTGQETVAEAAAAGRTGRRRYQHQVAAYRIDRALGLDMVPVTVLRKVKGKEGAVQVWITSAVDLKQLQENDNLAIVSGLERQIARGRAFTALIGLKFEDRLRQGKMVLPYSRRIMIADNGVSFSEDATIGRLIPEGCGPVGPAFLQELEELDSGLLRKELGPLLTAAQIDAVAERRDALIAACAEPDPRWSIRRIIEMQPSVD